MIGIFLGSFNPPHIGHMNAIQSVLESNYGNELDYIHIIPCRQNPNKVESIPYWIRYRMCTWMFKGLSNKVLIDDLEADHEFKYTYDMLKYLSSGSDKFIGKDFKWIITSETVEEIVNNKWYESSKILNEFGERMIVLSDGKTSKYEDLKYIDLNPGIDVHSTDIRKLVKENKSIDLFVNQEVIDIIKNENLYK